jgi:hypothetical protein
MLQIFIVLKNPSPSTGFEPANLESSDKDSNHYINENDSVYAVVYLQVLPGQIIPTQMVKLYSAFMEPEGPENPVTGSYSDERLAVGHYSESF